MDSLIKIEGKPIEKLIDVVSNAVGFLLEPWQMKRKSEAESSIAIEQAKTKALIEGDEKKAQYLDSIKERLVKKEKRRQKNIKEVVSTAGKILETEKVVSEEPVNSDWVTRFFDIVQDISDNEMQTLWGQILAGEIKQPQSYSIRTLEALRNMTKKDAELFQKFAQFVLLQDEAFILRDDLDEFGITYSDILKLTEIGLIHAGDRAVKNYNSKDAEERIITIINWDKVIIVKIDAQAPPISIPIRLLTTPGKDLIKLISTNANVDYIKKLASVIKTSVIKEGNKNIKISYSKILSINGDGSIACEPSIIEL